MNLSRTAAFVCCGVLAAGLLTGVSGMQRRNSERDDLHQKIDSLTHEASKLTAMTSQGVAFSEFRSQLASVHAGYDLLKEEWKVRAQPAGYGSFALAVSEWDLALIFWSRSVNRPRRNDGSEWPSKDTALLALYESNDPKRRAIVADSGQAALSLSMAARSFLSDANEHFEQSKNSAKRTQ